MSNLPVPCLQLYLKKPEGWRISTTKVFSHLPSQTGSGMVGSIPLGTPLDVLTTDLTPVGGRTLLPSILNGISRIANESDPLKILYEGITHQPFLSLFNMTKAVKMQPALANLSSDPPFSPTPYFLHTNLYDSGLRCRNHNRSPKTCGSWE